MDDYISDLGLELFEEAGSRALPTNKRGLTLTPGWRPSVKHNVKYCTGYCKASNTKVILGIKLPICKACAILAIVMQGPTYLWKGLITMCAYASSKQLLITRSPTKSSVRSWKLTKTEHHSESTSKGIFSMCMRLLKNQLPNEARSHFQQHVFGCVQKDKEIQAYLGLHMHKSILSLCEKFLCFVYCNNHFGLQQVPREH